MFYGLWYIKQFSSMTSLINPFHQLSWLSLIWSVPSYQLMVLYVHKFLEIRDWRVWQTVNSGHVSQHRGFELSSMKRVTNFIYNNLRRSVARQLRCSVNWTNILWSVCLRDWTAYNNTPFSCTTASKLRSVQYWNFLDYWHKLFSWWKWILRVAVSAFVVTMRKPLNTCFCIVTR